MDIFQDDLEAILEEHPVIHDFFEQAVERVPNLIAIETEGKSITYEELNNRANCLAYALRNNGLKTEQVVAIKIARSVEMIVSILAILKAGGAYLPIDMHAPRDRVMYILNDSKASILLYCGEVDEEYPNIKCLDIRKIVTETKVNNLRISMQHNQLAYVIYTSGSTGNPKGVMIEHGSAINRLLWMKDAYSISAQSRILQKTPYTFDVSVWELFLWFFACACLVLLPHGEENNLQIIGTYIGRFGVTDCHFIPSLLDSFLMRLYDGKEEIGNMKSLKNIYCSGEVLHYSTVKKFISSLYSKNGTRLHNLYGPTEATVDVTSFECTAHVYTEEVVPIGKAIANTEIYILSTDGQRCRDGEPGELYISGVNVGRGYVNQPLLTQERFVEDINYPGKRMFKTGDLAKWQGDLIIYLGRVDNQIKIRGMRVEPEEIEKVIMQVSSIDKIIVCGIHNGDNSSDTSLAGMYEALECIDVSKLRRKLQNKLPDYMIPNVFLHTQKLPLLSNGKIDRKEVKKQLNTLHNADELHQNQDEKEKVLSVIRSVVHPLVAENISLNQGINEAGIDSMTYLFVVVALEKAYNISFDSAMLAYATQTDINTLVDYVIAKARDASGRREDEVYIDESM